MKFGNDQEGAVPSLGVALMQLKSFQGFEFQVIRYQPVVNPVDLFIGPTLGKGGAWFSSKAAPHRISSEI